MESLSRSLAVLGETSLEAPQGAAGPVKAALASISTATPTSRGDERINLTWAVVTSQGWRPPIGTSASPHGVR